MFGWRTVFASPAKYSELAHLRWGCSQVRPMWLVHTFELEGIGEPTVWLAITSLSPPILDGASFLQHVSSYRPFHLLLSWVWPLKQSQAQRLWSPYGPGTERLVLWKKAFNCSRHFRVRHTGDHLAGSLGGLWYWQHPMGPWEQVG